MLSEKIPMERIPLVLLAVMCPSRILDLTGSLDDPAGDQRGEDRHS